MTMHDLTRLAPRLAAFLYRSARPRERADILGELDSMLDSVLDDRATPAMPMTAFQISNRCPEWERGYGVGEQCVLEASHRSPHAFAGGHR